MMKTRRSLIHWTQALLLSAPFAVACGTPEQETTSQLDNAGFEGIYDGVGRALTDLSDQCEYDADERVMTLTLEDDDIAVFARDTAGNVVINGFSCGDATSTTLRRLDVVEDGSAGDQILIIDYLAGTLALGNAQAPGVTVDLGGGTDSFRIRGSAQADSFVFGTDAVSINGDRFADMTLAGVESYLVSLGPGNDTFSGAGTTGDSGDPFEDTLTVYGGDGNDNLRGGAGDDELNGGLNDDTFTGGAEADGADVYAGGDGTDIADYSARTASVSVTIDGTDDDGAPGEEDNVGTDIENIRGSREGDYLEGSGSANSIFGGPGADTLAGLGGADVLSGDAGDDIIDEGAASNAGDTINGGAGIDLVDYSGRQNRVTVTINGMANDGEDNETDNVRTDVENVRGGDGNDIITGSTFANLIEGGEGEDTIDGGAGNDVLVGGADADELTGGPGNDRFDEEDDDSGSDTMIGGVGTDTIDYSARTSSVTVTLDNIDDDGQVGEADDVQSDVENILCGSGDDVVVGSGVANVITGGEGADEIDGGDGNDTISGGDDVDDITGGAGEDTIDGDDGTDVLDCGLGDGDICADGADCAAALACEL
jgi:Ca2+-binding RTX toxin-like protein